MAFKRKVLVIEDNFLNREMLTGLLSEEYEVYQAGNGEEGLAALKSLGDTVSLILLDVMMPVMDGYTFLDRIRQDEHLDMIPVIVMTQSGGVEEQIMALSHGATDFVPKPYNSQIILHRMANLIKLRETSAVVNQFKYDGLTGLYSKEFFYSSVRERLQEDPEGEYSIICSNIENFKLVNDDIIDEVPVGTIADHYILTLAEEENAKILSNDKFRDFSSEFPDIQSMRISFSIENNNFILGKAKKPKKVKNLLQNICDETLNELERKRWSVYKGKETTKFTPLNVAKQAILVLDQSEQDSMSNKIEGIFSKLPMFDKVMEMVESRMFCARFAVVLNDKPMLENCVLQLTEDVLVLCVISCGLYILVRLFRS